MENFSFTLSNDFSLSKFLVVVGTKYGDPAKNRLQKVETWNKPRHQNLVAFRSGGGILLLVELGWWNCLAELCWCKCIGGKMSMVKLFRWKCVGGFI